MHLKDLGIDPKTKIHNARLTTAENRFLGILWADYVGKENKISADALAMLFADSLNSLEFTNQDLPARLAMMNTNESGRKALGQWKRNVRRMYNHLLIQHENIPIMSKAGKGGGYWIAKDKEETEEFFNTFRQRGLTGFVKASRGKQAIIVDIMQQLSFEFDDLIDKTGFTRATTANARPTSEIPLQMVDRFLEQMTKNPEQFADGLRKIRQKYGSVLLPKEHVIAMKTKADELQELLAGLTG